ncbi:MAG: hypothetical protein V4563_14340 [Pseudomonadota bacterium]
MTFKKEISIDGVAVIVAAVALICWVVTIKNTQDTQAKVIEQHTMDLRQVNQTQSQMADSLSVLTTIVNERTGGGSTQFTPPTRR